MVAPGANEGGALTTGSVTTGVIDLGDLDSYTLSAQVGQRIQLSVRDVDAAAFVPALSLYDPTGASVGSNANATLAAVNVIAQRAGTFTVLVYDASAGAAATGPYELSFTLMP